MGSQDLLRRETRVFRAETAYSRWRFSLDGRVKGRTLHLCISILYKRYYKSDLDFCLDTGSCKEGLIVNTEYGKIEINKQNCQQYDWSWDEEFQRCQLK